MFKFFKRAWMGAGYLEGYGHHPGTGILAIYILASGLAGARDGGWNGFFGGMAIATVFFLPIFILGSVSRAKDYERDVEQTFERLKRDYSGQR